MNRIKINYSQYLLLIGEVQKNKQMRKTFVFSLPTSIGWNYFKPSVDTFNALCSALLYLFFYCPLFCTSPAPPHTLLWLLTGKIKKSDKVGQFFLHFAVCWFFFFFSFLSHFFLAIREWGKCKQDASAVLFNVVLCFSPSSLAPKW